MLRAASRLASQIGPIFVAATFVLAYGTSVTDAKGFKIGGAAIGATKASRSFANGKRAGEALADEAPGESRDNKAAANKSAPVADDYYSRRARYILSHETGAWQGPHPLQTAHPGMDVVVCEAGCSTELAEIVYIQPTNKTEPAAVPAAEDGKLAKTVDNTNSGDIKKTPAAVPVVRPYEIVCEGGCYDTPRVYQAAQSRVTIRLDAPGWQSTVTPTSASGKAPASGEWMRKIDLERGE
ncbi:MAG: hypothetical protein KDJ37_07855 [Hyphomicrobiaceae bacterium]|nr:hypothetical protein [Hyphomicrobiaceae bacterium]